MSPTIHWPQFNKSIEVASGTSILDAALGHDIPLEHACGGFCACTTCHVHIKEGAQNVSKMESEEADRLEYKDGLTPQSRLGCQTKILGDVTVEIP